MEIIMCQMCLELNKLLLGKFLLALFQWVLKYYENNEFIFFV